MSEAHLARNHSVFRNHAFAATTAQVNIPIDHMVEIVTGYTFQQNGGTAPTLLDIKGDFIDEYVMTLGGIEFCRLDWIDVCHMQNLWFGETPDFLIPAGDDCYGYFSPVVLPLSLDKDLAGSLRKVTAQWTVGALTDVDNVVLQANIPYHSNQKASWLPGGYHYAYQYKTFTASTTRQFISFDREGADLLGLLLYSCTIPTAASLNTSIDEVVIYVNGQPVYGPVAWESMRNFKQTQDVLDDTNFGAQTDNYKYIDLSWKPLPADDLDISTVSVGATDAGQKIIGIFMEP